MSTTPTTPADDAVMCPVNPLGHEYRGTTRCAYCGKTRTAREAIVSMLAGGIRSGIGEERAEALVTQMIAEERQHAEPLLWGKYEDDWTAQDAGHRWMIVRHAKDGEHTGEIVFTLWARPMVTGWRKVAQDCPSLEDAQRAAEEAR